MRRRKHLRPRACVVGALTSLALSAGLAVVVTHSLHAQANTASRPRARELGVAPGIFPTGARNAITDVQGVTVGQVTITEGDSVRTGVTAILPHGGNLYRERVPAALHVGNGFGKLL